MSILLQNTTPENVLQGIQICTLPNIQIEKKVMFKMLSSEGVQKLLELTCLIQDRLRLISVCCKCCKYYNKVIAFSVQLNCDWNWTKSAKKLNSWDKDSNPKKATLKIAEHWNWALILWTPSGSGDWGFQKNWWMDGWCM